MRKWVVLVALILGVVFTYNQMAEINSILATLRRGDWRYLFLAFCTMGAWFFVNGWLYHHIYIAMDMQESPWRLTTLSAAGEFANMIAPSMGMSQLAVFISEGRRRSLPSGRVSMASLLYILVNYLAFLIILTAGLFVLERRSILDTAILSAAGILACATLMVVFTLWIGARSENRLAHLLIQVSRPVNYLASFLSPRVPLSEIKLRNFAHHASTGLQIISARHQNLYFPLILALANKLMLIAVMALMFMAFQAPMTLGAVVGGWSVGYLFLIVSPTPNGIGVVEGLLVLALRHMNVEAGDATVIVMAYRGFTFWLQVLVGFIAFRLLEHHFFPSQNSHVAPEMNDLIPFDPDSSLTSASQDSVESVYNKYPDETTLNQT